MQIKKIINTEEVVLVAYKIFLKTVRDYLINNITNVYSYDAKETFQHFIEGISRRTLVNPLFSR